MDNRRFAILIAVAVGLAIAHFSAVALLVFSTTQTPRLDRIDRTLDQLQQQIHQLKRGPDAVQIQDQTVQVVIDYLKSTGHSIDQQTPEQLRRARDRIQSDLDRIVREHQWRVRKNNQP